jgi:hypothetical protein
MAGQLFDAVLIFSWNPLIKLILGTIITIETLQGMTKWVNSWQKLYPNSENECYE